MSTHEASAGASPFHDGEQRVQLRLGHREQVAAIGARAIRDHLPEQHREFYAGQHLLLAGSADRDRQPWVSVLAGAPGFAHAPDPRRLRIDALPAGGAPGLRLAAGQRLGLLGIDHSNRRRNRVNGRVEAVDDGGFTLAVEQSFGNCPKYIARRVTRVPPGDAWRLPAVPAVRADLGDERVRRLIRRADHFYIASHHLGDAHDVRAGVDVSHRGGRAGFVGVEADRTLVFPDFAGNRFFNTLGNIEATGRAGLAFVDVDDGSLLTLTGEAAVDWRDGAGDRLAGAERLVRVTPRSAWLHPRLLPFAWELVEPSPFLDGTGVWATDG